MESYFAHIENEIVTFVEVVTDDFFNANQSRYSGKWLKVGEGSTRKFCSIGDIYLPDTDQIIQKKPFPSWILSNGEWTPPKPKPDQRCYWDENTLSWVII